MSPGGRTPNSRRGRPEEPPSSVTVTTPVSCLRRSDPTWCFSPRRSTDRPVPPPTATSFLPGPVSRSDSRSGETEELAVVAVLADFGKVGVVVGMDAVLGVQLDRPGQRLRRLLDPALGREDCRGEVGEAFVLLLAALLAAEVEGGRQVAAVLLEHGLE